MSARSLFTEYENHLTADMPTLVAVGYVNARRRDGRGERADKRLVVTGIDTVTQMSTGGPVGHGGSGPLLGGLFGFGGPW